MNTKRRDELTKEFLEENYVDENGARLTKELSDYLDCSNSMTNKQYKRLGVQTTNKTKSKLNQKNLLTLSKEFLEENYVDENNCRKTKELSKYLDCSIITANKQFKKFNVSFKDGRQPHTNLKNFNLLSKEFLEENYIDKNGAAMEKELALFLGTSPKNTITYFHKFKVSFVDKRHTHLNFKNIQKLSKNLIEKKFQDEEGFIDVKVFKEFTGYTSTSSIYKICQNFRVRYEIRAQDKNLNRKIYNQLSKEFIEEHYLDEDGFINISLFITDLNCAPSSVYYFCKKFLVPFRTKSDNKSGFNLIKPAMVYYFLDTETNFYKLGITGKGNIFDRFCTPFHRDRIKLLYTEEFEYGYQAKERETELHKEFSEFRITNQSWITEGSEGNLHLNGATEFFNRDVLNLDT